MGIFTSKKKKLLSAIESHDELDKLLSKIDDINELFKHEERQQWCYLLHACKYGDSSSLSKLIDAGADHLLKDENEKTSLYWAAANENVAESVKICNLLLEKGIDINLQSNDGRTALFSAAIGANVDVIELLINAGADTNLATEGNLTPLYLVAQINSQSKIAKSLINAGANINVVEDVDGCLPIYPAIELDNLDLVKLLVESGTDLSHTDTNGLTCLDFAVSHDKQEIAKYLHSKGADYNPDITQLEVMLKIDIGDEKVTLPTTEDDLNNYCLIFTNVNKAQSDDLIVRYNEWKGVLQVTETVKTCFEDNHLIIKFISSLKEDFYDDEDHELCNPEENIYYFLTGKENFYSNLYYSSTENYENVNAYFATYTSKDCEIYCMTISKDSDEETTQIRDSEPEYNELSKLI